MIIQNGYISVANVEDGANALDVNGNPRRDIGFDNPTVMPCNYVRNSYQGRGVYEAGEFTSASYTILVEGDGFKPCIFRLYDLSNNLLGEYEVSTRGIVYLQAVGNTQITV